MHLEFDSRILPLVVRVMVEGRFSKGYLELRKGDYRASDGVLTKFVEAVQSDKILVEILPSNTFVTSLKVKSSYYYNSLAYKNMMELGFSPDETADALKPYQIIE